MNIVISHGPFLLVFLAPPFFIPLLCFQIRCVGSTFLDSILFIFVYLFSFNFLSGGLLPPSDELIKIVSCVSNVGESFVAWVVRVQQITPMKMIKFEHF